MVERFSATEWFEHLARILKHLRFEWYESVLILECWLRLGVIRSRMELMTKRSLKERDE